MEIKSTSDALTYLYKLSLNREGFRFRGQADCNWSVKPSIYRYSDFFRYQTTIFEKHILSKKPQKPNPPLTHTDFDLEWLMVCQHYEVPTRLIDWSFDILSALFFACYGETEMGADGILYIIRQSDYPLFHQYKESLGNSQELAFVSTNVINPRMRNQSGCFMMWGHSPFNDTTETYDLLQYHSHKGDSFFLEKHIIPSKSKQKILDELNTIYSINFESVYLKNGYLETKYGKQFKELKETAKLITLHLTEAEKLTEAENNKVISMSGGVNRRNMFGNCLNIR
jgi:hypothetical protein